MTKHEIKINTIEEIKYFLNRFYEEKFTLETKALLPSEQLLYPNKKLLIKKGNSNRVINDISKERTLNLFKLSKK
jgi:hypothetical protein